MKKELKDNSNNTLSNNFNVLLENMDDVIFYEMYRTKKTKKIKNKKS